jgi:mRNA-degrading endonuclease RelE of RelBE toxin-antitoxin system
MNQVINTDPGKGHIALVRLLGYERKIAKPAEKNLKYLSSSDAKRIIDRISELEQDPFNGRISKKLKGVEERTSRVGTWRIIFIIDCFLKEVHILHVLPRGRAYRKF